MKLPFIHRDPTKAEFERFRLILSTYQDGSGQQVAKDGLTLPGWRDFERSIALAFDGTAQENKFIFDVLIPDPKRPHVSFGLSCKMRRTLTETHRTGRVVLELSNSSGKFWERLGKARLHQRNYRKNPSAVAEAILGLDREWHEQVGLEINGRVDLSKSFYLALSWNQKGDYQMFKYSIELPKAHKLVWDFPAVIRQGAEASGRRLRGMDKFGTIFEWYGESGGQLKYYPLVSDALWKSEVFRLQPLPLDWIEKHGIEKKAQDYFPSLWK